MKLRLRPMEARVGGGAAETHRVEVPPTATLADIRALLAAKLSAVQPVPAESVRFSLNRTEELVSPDPAAALPDLGLASGDLVYFTLSPLWVPTPPAQAAAAPRLNPTPADASVARAVDGLGKCTEQPGRGGGDPSSQMDVNPGVPMESDPADVVMAKAVDTTKVWSSFVLRDLKREIENVAGAAGTVVGRLVAALHAALLDVGLRPSNPMGSRISLPRDWLPGASVPLIIKYLVPEVLLLSPVAEDGKVVVLNFSVMGNFITVYGYVPGVQSEMRRLCLELPKLEPLLYLDSDQLSPVQERGVFELWRVLKDEMCLPLMISLCQLNSLRLPPCLMALPADLKTRILEFVPGVDLARVECTCKEMQVLAADDNLWSKRVMLKFGGGATGSNNAKAWFAEAFAANKRWQKRPRQTFWNYGWGNPPFPPHRFPVVRW